MRKLLLIFLLPSSLFGQIYNVGTDQKVYIRAYDSSTFLPKTGISGTSFSCDCIQNDGTLTSWTATASGGAHDVVEITGGTSQGIYSVELVGASDVNVHGTTTLACKGSGFISPMIRFTVIEDPSYQRTVVGDIAIPEDVADIDLSTHTTAGTAGAYWANADAPVSSMLGSISGINLVLGTPVSTDLSTDIANIPVKQGNITGTAQAGGSTSLTLATTAPAVTSSLVDNWITITGGTGAGQTAMITAYDGSTKVATTFCRLGTNGAWLLTPDSTSTYVTTPNVKH